jgi:hypothetical protein
MRDTMHIFIKGCTTPLVQLINRLDRVSHPLNDPQKQLLKMMLKNPARYHAFIALGPNMSGLLKSGLISETILDHDAPCGTREYHITVKGRFWLIRYDR